MKPKAKATVVKSVKIEPETLFEIENDPRYTDFSTFTRDDLMVRICANAKASKRTPAQVLRDAIEMLPVK